ncbi:MAG TPA: methylmalonyl Co-A mutase-associated GTPase MeaB [Flavisolibacter sp.]|nr:methylmalonyl Co-A mutase-associated GTPase MeaB [Flavisolibacter sp.]
MWQQLLKDLQNGNPRALARSISFVENGQEGYEALMQALPPQPNAAIIGITGPPGAGKSTLTDALIGELLKDGKKVAVLCVDPSSPFNLGAVLGDRIRMSDWYTHPSVFIRSLATRGSMGGLHPRIIEITDLVKAAGYDYVIVETVGVGQSEVEIAGLADVTVVVVVPEAGDEVQTMKAGLMEIADIFVVNKSDRPDADLFVRNLRLMLAPAFANHAQEVPVIKTVASEKKGVTELKNAILSQLQSSQANEKQSMLLAEKAWLLIQTRRMADLSKKRLREQIAAAGSDFNLYRFIEKF